MEENEILTTTVLLCIAAGLIGLLVYRIRMHQVSWEEDRMALVAIVLVVVYLLFSAGYALCSTE